MYISRKVLVQTSFRAAGRSRKDRGRNRDGTSRANRSAPKMNGNESPNPIPPVARNFPATTRPMCATGRMLQPLLRTSHEKKREQDTQYLARSWREQADGKPESL